MFDFDELIDRRSTNSVKWATGRKLLTPEQYAADPLPMWVADMDFRVAPPIRHALLREVEFGIFGYGTTPDSYVDAVVKWHHRRYDWDVKPEWLVRAPGVVNAINVVIHAFTNPGDYVVALTPAYHHFHEDVTINGRQMIQVPLNIVNSRYQFDPEAFEAALKPGTKIFILCHPHNPTGNVWTREELRAMAEICDRRGLLVISDEVHSDFVFGGGKRHIPYASVSETMAQHSITCTAPSKTFNMAGLQCANVFVPNERLRREYRVQTERMGVTMSNLMGTVACEVAYRHGDAWVDAMIEYVRGNQEHFAARAEALELPFAVIPTDALYLAWLDFRELKMSDEALNDCLLRRARLWLDRGTKFGLGGAGFMRINLGCSRTLVDEAINRLKDGLTKVA